MGPVEREAWTARQLVIPQRLRTRRCELGLTQKQVVTRLARCGVRTTNRALSGLEHGAGIDVAKLPELAAALDCTVTYLMGLTEHPHRWEPDAPSVVVPVATLRPVPDGRRNQRDDGEDRNHLVLGGILSDEVPEGAHRFGSSPPLI